MPARCLTRCCLSALALTLALGGSAVAQTVPGPVIKVVVDSVPTPTCEGGLAEPFSMTYGTCYRPTGVSLGSPFITALKVTVTPQGGGTPVVTSVPRAQITRGTDAATCAPNAAPCLLTPFIPALVGNSTAVAAFVDGEGREASAVGVPFVGARPILPAPPNPTAR